MRVTIAGLLRSPRVTGGTGPSPDRIKSHGINFSKHKKFHTFVEILPVLSWGSGAQHEVVCEDGGISVNTDSY